MVKDVVQVEDDAPPFRYFANTGAPSAQTGTTPPRVIQSDLRLRHVTGDVWSAARLEGKKPRVTSVVCSNVFA